MPFTGPIPYTPPQTTFVPGGSPPFTFQELDMMRTYMMTPKTFATPGAMLEGIFTAINGFNNDPQDMGWTQFAIRQVLYNLTQLEFQLSILENVPVMSTVQINGKIEVDPQGTAFIYRYIDGPALIAQLASRLAYFPDQNYFAPVKLTRTSDHIAYRRPKMY